MRSARRVPGRAAFASAERATPGYHGRMRARAIAISVIGITLLAGCAQGSTAPMASPAPPSSTPLAPQALAEQPLLDSRWTGVDSAGDTTAFTLQSDHTVGVTYNGQSWDDPNDTWSLEDGVLTITVHIDPTHGQLRYTAPYTEGSETLDATATATVSGRTLTVSLQRH